jgi:hypothetical protein
MGEAKDEELGQSLSCEEGGESGILHECDFFINRPGGLPEHCNDIPGLGVMINPSFQALLSSPLLSSPLLSSPLLSSPPLPSPPLPSPLPLIPSPSYPLSLLSSLCLSHGSQNSGFKIFKSQKIHKSEISQRR